jgi:hypothetical protein
VVGHHGCVDVPLVAFGSCMVILAAVLAYVSVSYQPESTPLTPARPPEFGVVVKSSAVVGALVVGFGALGFGGFVLAAVGCAAIRVARL